MFGLFWSKVRIGREEFDEIGGSARNYIQNLADANARVNSYLAQAIGTQPTPVQWARAIKMFLPNDHEVLQSAEKLDNVLKLRGSLTKKFARLLQLVGRLESAGLSDNCIGPAKAVLSYWPSVARMLQKIESTHVK